MEEKIRNIAIVILIIIVGIWFYPAVVKVENGKTHCYNFFGYRASCREQSYP